MDKNEFKFLKKGIKEIFYARGSNKEPIKQESSTIRFAYASVAATKDILKGQKLSKKIFFLGDLALEIFLPKTTKC